MSLYEWSIFCIFFGEKPLPAFEPLRVSPSPPPYGGVAPLRAPYLMVTTPDGVLSYCRRPEARPGEDACMLCQAFSCFRRDDGAGQVLVAGGSCLPLEPEGADQEILRSHLRGSIRLFEPVFRKSKILCQMVFWSVRPSCPC